jgi:MFS family permease
MSVETGVIRTRIPARMDRLPWSRFHWLVVIGLGTVWILDGLEVTIVGSVAARLTEKGSGIAIGAGQIGTAAAFYVAGACVGALFFGQLTDRFGRKKLFIITLAVYITATVVTAFSFAPWFFYAARFFTGSGIGGEYAAINSAIDELIPARVRGRVDLIINGSYWVGAAGGAIAALFFLDTSIFAKDFGWRLAFGVGAILGLLIMVVRRHVPESPRWMFIHGREEEAERLVDQIERDVLEHSDVGELPEPGQSITVRQRKAIPFREIAQVAVRAYPKRAILGFCLFVGQAFLYNAITFDLGTLLSGFFKVASGSVPFYTALFAVSNFMGPLLLGRLFDTVGRKPMIAGTYLATAAISAILAGFFLGDALGTWGFMAFILVIFFLASAGASSAYLTVSEIFPMETRALAIAFFYAIGTAAGGITGPLLFGHLIGSGEHGQVALGFWIGAAVMALGGVAELLYGVKAEGQSLEDIATPLTAEEAQEGTPQGALAEGDEELPAGVHRARAEALRARERAEEERARAAEHRAAAIEARAAETDGGAPERAEIEELLAEMAELRARAADERAAAQDERAQAEQAGSDAEREAAEQRAGAAEQRARVHDEQVEALAAEHEDDAQRHVALAEAATERARAREHAAGAAQARAEAKELAGDGDGGERDARAEVARARAEMHERWREAHAARARAAELRARDDDDGAERSLRDGEAAEQAALAAGQLVEAAEHRRTVAEMRGEESAAEESASAREAAAEQERLARERERRIRERLERRRAASTGLRRFRPGPGRFGGVPSMVVPSAGAQDDEDLDREIDMIGRALEEHGAIERRELARVVGARYWGPGRFRAALREALADGRARHVGRSTYGPPGAAQDAGRERSRTGS